MKEKIKDKKKYNVEEGRTHIPLLQHKSPGESDHGTSCRTGLLIRHSNSHSLRLTHRHRHTVLDPVHLVPSQCRQCG